jgi:hypothetical protein
MKLRESHKEDLSVIGTNVKINLMNTLENSIDILGTTFSNSNLPLQEKCHSNRLLNKKNSQNVHIDLARDFLTTSLSKVVDSSDVNRSNEPKTVPNKPLEIEAKSKSKAIRKRQYKS